MADKSKKDKEIKADKSKMGKSTMAENTIRTKKHHDRQEQAGQKSIMEDKVCLRCMKLNKRSYFSIEIFQ